MMIFLRPILSESEPKMMKKGVARMSEPATSMFAAWGSSFSAWSRKNSS